MKASVNKWKKMKKNGISFRNNGGKYRKKSLEELNVASCEKQDRKVGRTQPRN